MSNARAACAHTCRRRGERKAGRGEGSDWLAVHSSEMFVTNLQSKTHQLTRQQQQLRGQQQQQLWQPSLCINEWTVSSQHSVGFVSVYVYICIYAGYIQTARQYELISIKKGFSFVIRKLLLFCCCCCEWNASMNIKLSMEIWAIKWDRDSNRIQSERERERAGKWQWGKSFCIVYAAAWLSRSTINGRNSANLRQPNGRG